MTINETIEFLGCSRRTVDRYIESGKLPYTMKGKKKHFKKKDLAPLLLKLMENQEKHRPDTQQPNEKLILNQSKMVKKVLKKPTTSILNETGKKVLLSTTKYIEEKGLLQTTTKEPILRYAIATQLFEKYQAMAVENDDKYFFDLAKIQTDMIKHYETQLGLTPAALAKIKPQEEKEAIDVDPMEDLLS